MGNIDTRIDVLMAGVGGQGVVLASDILAEVAMEEGYDVKKSDTLGMAQRGGSVVSHVRLGKTVFSPLIKRGDVDLLLSFEKLEAARWAVFLRRDGIAIVNDQAIPPWSVSSGAEKYPTDQEVMAILGQCTQRIYVVPGLAMAQRLGNAQVLNVLMMGFLSAFLPLSEEAWTKSLRERVPARFLELNLQAFKEGRAAASQALAVTTTGVEAPAPK